MLGIGLGVTEQRRSAFQALVSTLYQGGAVQGLITAPFSDFSKLWQDSAGTIPVTAVGQPVARVQDVSGNGYFLTQPSGGSIPVLAQDANGYYGLSFDGTNDYLSVASSTAAFKYLHDGTGGSLFAAVAWASPLTVSKIYAVASSGAASNSNGFALYTAEGFGAVSASQQINTTIANGAATVINGTSGGVGTVRGDGVGQVLGFTYKTQAGSDFRAYTDGDNFNLGRAEANSPSALASATDLSVGRYGTFYAKGLIYGFATVAKEISVAERRQLITHLRSLYGDAGHFIALGDSHTYNTAYGIYAQSFYPARVEAARRAAGRKLVSLSYGVSGNTTGNIFARLSSVLEDGAPDFAVVYAGQNDTTTTTVQAAPAPTATTFTVGAGAGAGFPAGTEITVNGVAATVLSVAADAITLTAPRAGGAPAAGNVVAVDTAANLAKIVSAIRGAGCSRVVICGAHYMNFASGGDTTSVQVAPYAALRVVQAAAAVSNGALFVDLYAYMRALIVAGTYLQGSDTVWHVAIGNTHLNATGEQILADAINAALTAQGW
jgi:lysophospholipase L1-like esterase